MDGVGGTAPLAHAGPAPTPAPASQGTGSPWCRSSHPVHGRRTGRAPIGEKVPQGRMALGATAVAVHHRRVVRAWRSDEWDSGDDVARRPVPGRPADRRLGPRRRRSPSGASLVADSPVRVGTTGFGSEGTP